MNSVWKFLLTESVEKLEHEIFHSSGYKQLSENNNDTYHLLWTSETGKRLARMSPRS